MSDYLEQLTSAAPLRDPALRSAIRALDLPRNSRGLDVGCGAGLQCILLAEALGPGANIIGIDIDKQLLEHGRKLVDQAGLSRQISLEQAHAQTLPFPDNAFDWVWSADCVGYGPWDPRPMLDEILRVLRDDGKIAILAWSSEKLLPGFPRLEARLQATKAGLAPFRPAMNPNRHFSRFLGVLRELGFTDLGVDTFAGTVHAPLDEAHRSALELLLEMRWTGAELGLDDDDIAEYQRLTGPSSSDFILDHPDYYAFYTYSMFTGRSPSH